MTQLEDQIRTLSNKLSAIGTNLPSRRTGLSEVRKARLLVAEMHVELASLDSKLCIELGVPVSASASEAWKSAAAMSATATTDQTVALETAKRLKRMGLDAKFVGIKSAADLPD